MGSQVGDLWSNLSVRSMGRSDRFAHKYNGGEQNNSWPTGKLQRLVGIWFYGR